MQPMMSLIPLPKPAVRSWLKICNVSLNRMLCNDCNLPDFESPRILVIANELNLILALPKYVCDGLLKITVFDLCFDTIYQLETSFPFCIGCIQDGVYFSNYLYIYGMRGNACFFLCTFNFKDCRWSIVLRETVNKDNPNYMVKGFMTKSTGVRGVFNFSNRTLLVLDVTEKNGLKFTQSQTTNCPPKVGPVKMSDDQDRLWAHKFQDGVLESLVTLHLPSLTWKTLKLRSLSNAPMFKSIPYSSFIKDDTITYFVPYLQGTHVLRLNLKSLDAGWILQDPIFPTIVETKFCQQSNELYALCARSDECDDGYFLSVVSWTFSVPKLQQMCLKVIMECIDTKVHVHKLKTLCLPIFYTDLLSDRLSILQRLPAMKKKTKSISADALFKTNNSCSVS